WCPRRRHGRGHLGRLPTGHAHPQERRIRPHFRGAHMAISTNELKNGMSLSLTEGLFQVVDFQHVKPGKGHAFVRTTLRHVRTGGQVERTFRAGEKLDRAMIDKREMQYLYRDG